MAIRDLVDGATTTTTTTTMETGATAASTTNVCPALAHALLTSSLPGRIWQGKEAVLEALVYVCMNSKDNDMMVVDDEGGRGWLWEGEDGVRVWPSSLVEGGGKGAGGGGDAMDITNTSSSSRWGPGEEPLPPPPPSSSDGQMEEEELMVPMVVDEEEEEEDETVVVATTPTTSTTTTRGESMLLPLPVCRHVSLWGIARVLVGQVQRSSSSRDYQRVALTCIGRMAMAAGGSITTASTTSTASTTTLWWDNAYPLLANLAGINASSSSSGEVAAVIRASAIETLGAVFPRLPTTTTIAQVCTTTARTSVEGRSGRDVVVSVMV